MPKTRFMNDLVGRATNRDLVGPNTVHGRYEFDRLAAQGARRELLATMYLAITPPQANTYWVPMSKLDTLTHMVREAADELIAYYMDTGQMPADAINALPRGSGNRIWVALVRREDVPENFVRYLDATEKEA